MPDDPQQLRRLHRVSILSIFSVSVSAYLEEHGVLMLLVDGIHDLLLHGPEVSIVAHASAVGGQGSAPCPAAHDGDGGARVAQGGSHDCRRKGLQQHGVPAWN